MTLLDRLPLALVVSAVALATDALVTQRDGFGVSLCREKSAGEARATRIVRIGLAVASASVLLVMLSGAAKMRRPDRAFATTFLAALLLPWMVQVAASVLRRRAATDGVPGPRLIDVSQPPTLRSLLCGPLQLLLTSVLVTTVLFFRWLLPFLPSVARVHWSHDAATYASPTRLWWALAPVAFYWVTTLAVAAAAAHVDSAARVAMTSGALALDRQRRAQVVRLVETLFVGLGVLSLVIWVVAAVAMVPGASPRLAMRGAMGIGLLALLLTLVTLAVQGPALLAIARAIRQEQRA